MNKKFYEGKVRNQNELEEICGEAFRFLKKASECNLDRGEYRLSNGIYASIDIYDTKDASECKYETHKRYVDIQCIMKGCEAIWITDKNNLIMNGDYLEDKDIAFYETVNKNRKEYYLEENQFIVIFPGTPHMPCVNLSEAKSVSARKIVFKIPLSYFVHVKYLVLDVDGTLTDGRIIIGSDGELFKSFNVKDGYALKEILAENGITPIILTSRESVIVTKRCEELGITALYQGVHDKAGKLSEIAEYFNADLSGFAYIGDDMNDIPAINLIRNHGGLAGCPRNAPFKVKEAVDYVSMLDGGKGAVRDYIEWLVCYG